MRFVFIFLSVFAFSNSSVAQEADKTRFSIYKPNFVMWSIPSNKSDEPGLQVRFSAKYDILECNIQEDLRNVVSKGICNSLSAWEPIKRFGTAGMFISYTTDFDFYIASNGNRVLRRDSAPVRNRMTSPGLHIQWSDPINNKKIGAWDYEKFTMSLVHHSNGQDIESDTFFEQTPSSEELVAFISDLQGRNPAWSDGISRGWNYIELAWQSSTTVLDNNKNIDQSECDLFFRCVRANSALRIPFGSTSDNPIWWQPGNDRDFTKRNHLEFNLRTDWSIDERLNKWAAFKAMGLSLTSYCGTEGCSGLKGIFRLDTQFGEEGNTLLPLMLYFHRGRNEHLYNYHQEANMIGLGLSFNY